jgi:hypothetical protein
MLIKYYFIKTLFLMYIIVSQNYIESIHKISIRYNIKITILNLNYIIITLCNMLIKYIILKTLL